MFDERYLNTLKNIYKKLQNIKIKWYVTGKANLALQGFNIQPTKITILIHSEDLEIFNNIFFDCKRTSPQVLTNGEAIEFSMSINDIKVLVCAEHKHGTYFVFFKPPTIINIENMKIPCFNIESEKKAYARWEKFSKIKYLFE